MHVLCLKMPILILLQQILLKVASHTGKDGFDKPMSVCSHFPLLVFLCAISLCFLFMFKNSGQRCTAVKVVLVIESVADILVEKVITKMNKLTVGAPEDDRDITAVVSESSAKFIEGLVIDAKEKGATFCQVKYPIYYDKEKIVHKNLKYYLPILRDI